MKSGPFPWLVWVIILDVLSSGAAETNRPDCVGIRLGMSIAEARERLQRCEPKLEIQTAELQIPELGANPVPEILYGVRMPPSRTGALPAMDPIEPLQAAITLPPNKPVVWKVVRSLRFEPGRKQSKSALLGTLHDKYGKESLTLDQATGKVTCFWVLQPDGKPLEGQAAQGCSTFCQRNFMNSLALDDALARGGNKELTDKLRTTVFLAGIGNRQAVLVDSYCSTLTYIVAEFSVGANPQLVNQMRVALIDAPLHRIAAGATETMINEAKAARAKQDADKATEQPTPKL